MIQTYPLTFTKSAKRPGTWTWADCTKAEEVASKWVQLWLEMSSVSEFRLTLHLGNLCPYRVTEVSMFPESGQSQQAPGPHAGCDLVHISLKPSRSHCLHLETGRIQQGKHKGSSKINILWSCYDKNSTYQRAEQGHGPNCSQSALVMFHLNRDSQWVSGTSDRMHN